MEATFTTLQSFMLSTTVGMERWTCESPCPNFPWSAFPKLRMSPPLDEWYGLRHVRVGRH
jgi:hypothetical protein